MIKAEALRLLRMHRQGHEDVDETFSFPRKLRKLRLAAGQHCETDESPKTLKTLKDFKRLYKALKD